MWLTFFFYKPQIIDNNEKDQNPSKGFEQIFSNIQDEKVDENDIEKQIKAQYQNILREYRCLICNLKSFSTQEKLDRHNSMMHEVNSENRHFRCEFCNSFFANVSTLNRHEFSRCLKRKIVQDNIAPRFSFDKISTSIGFDVPSLGPKLLIFLLFSHLYFLSHLLVSTLFVYITLRIFIIFQFLIFNKYNSF